MGVNLEQDALENPTQRAFAYVSAMKDLQNHGTGADPNPDNNGTALKMEPGGASQSS